LKMDYDDEEDLILDVSSSSANSSALNTPSSPSLGIGLGETFRFTPETAKIRFPEVTLAECLRTPMSLHDIAERIEDSHEDDEATDDVDNRFSKTVFLSSELALEWKHLQRVYTNHRVSRLTREVSIHDRSRDRYHKILPYEFNRVKVNDIESDYFNGSYIKSDLEGKKHDITYISTQCPNESTIGHFWKVALDKRTLIIVNLCSPDDDIKRWDCYYPTEVDETLVADGAQITLLSLREFKDYVVRKFKVVCDSDSIEVTQLHYLSWWDKGVPRDIQSYFDFFVKCRQMREEIGFDEQTDCQMIHCSAGVGRTGTFIAHDILADAIDNQHNTNNLDTETKFISVASVISSLRKQRVHMVQTEQQYLFVYKFVARYSQLYVM